MRDKIEEIITRALEIAGNNNQELIEPVVNDLLALFHSEKKEKELDECYFNFGNKTCRGKIYPICSSHLDLLMTISRSRKRQKLEELKK